MSEKIITIKTIFDGEKFLENHAILTKNRKIKQVLPVANVSKENRIHQVKGTYLAPAYKDLQINGAGGIMFSANPSINTIKAIYDYGIAGGATGFLVTLPTNSLEVIKKSINAIHDYWEMGLPGLIGFHIEGPYISLAKKGAHNPDLIKKPTLDEVKEIVEYGKGAVKMITLAPEVCSDEVIDYLLKQGVILAAGHSNATYQEAMHGFSLGINLCTHLYNAMSPFTHHDPGLVGAAFDSTVYSGIIPDDIHTHEAALRIADKMMGDRLFFVTDAITETHNESYQYILNGDHYVTEKGTLAGSCLTMETAVQKGIEMGFRPKDVLRKASLIPAQILGEDHRWGRIAPGYEVDWVVLDENFKVIQTITE